MASLTPDDFKTRLANLLKARFPCLYISTWEEERALSVIREVASDESLIKTLRSVSVWSATNGLIDDKQRAREETKAPLKLLEIIENETEPSIYLLKDFHVYFGAQGRPADTQVIRKLRDIMPSLKNSRRPKNIILISPSLTLPYDLQKDITIVDFELPSFGEIRKLLDEMIEANRGAGRIQIELDSQETERLAKAALGLTLQEAENAFAHAMVRSGALKAEDVEVVLDEKRQIIKKTEVLEFIKTDMCMDDVGGLENLKRWLKKRDRSWDDAAQRYGLPSPKGVLITGVPGCGKSLIAKAISAAWQLPLLRLDLGKIFSGLVGSSEENMRKAIKTAEAIAPSVLWIDEIEKGFVSSGGGGDGGTASRVFGTFLTWMQEKTKPVFVVATANQISALPAELLRKGRFDEIFFVDLPTRRERSEIFMLHIGKRQVSREAFGESGVNNETSLHLAELTEGFVGAEIEQIVISALFEAFSEERPIQLTDFEKAIKNTVPLSVTQAEQIRGIRDWANVRAVAATAPEDRAEYTKLAEKAPAPESDRSGADIVAVRGGRTVDF
jgi:SpoVK/Ycf46/Vps4 family AAA+-type ATPase